MGRFLIVTNVDNLQEYKKIAEKYDLGFELNDFCMPEVLADRERQQKIINCYRENGLPQYYTMHGAFMDVLIFSYDDDIRRISEKRMEDSMRIARELGAKAVIFHTNVNPFLAFEMYEQRMIDYTVKFIEKLLIEYQNINIYLENMFDRTPHILSEISKRLSGYRNYGVCFDYAHARISQTPLSEWLEHMGPYIKHVHINDNDLVNDLHLAVGDGCIDWKQFVEYYHRYFEDCTILIETKQPENQVKSLQYLSTIGSYVQ